MAEPQGIAKTNQDVARQLLKTYRGIQGFRGEVGRNIGNVGRYFASQAPVDAPASAAQQAAANNQMAEVARLGGPAALRAATDRGVSDAQLMQNNPNPDPADPRGPGGPGGAANPINALFAPMFQNLRQQKKQANQRYEANKNQVTNIYGQITTARSQDIGALETAFKRLVDAASTRSTAVNTRIDTAEASRLAGNQAALQSMGLEGLSTSQGDVASQGAALAQQTNTLNAENWQNLLQASGRNAQGIAQADVDAYRFAGLEAQGQLRGAREEFAQDLGQQRFELTSKKAQATFEYQQAQQRAAAAAAAAKQRAKADKQNVLAQQEADALKASGPVTTTINNYVRLGLIDAGSAAKVQNVVTEWYQNVPPPPAGKWNRSSATNSILSLAGASLSEPEKAAIQAIFSNSKW